MDVNGSARPALMVLPTLSDASPVFMVLPTLSDAGRAACVFPPARLLLSVALFSLGLRAPGFRGIGRYWPHILTQAEPHMSSHWLGYRWVLAWFSSWYWWVLLGVLVGIAGYCGGIGGYWSQVLMSSPLFRLDFCRKTCDGQGYWCGPRTPFIILKGEERGWQRAGATTDQRGAREHDRRKF